MLDGIFSFFGTIANVISSLFTGIIQFFGYLLTAGEAVASLYVYLPSDLQALATAFIGVSIVFLVVGRTGKSN